jgi:monofunctional biosynthetic peptidoglycan transglycosylase
MIKLFFKIIFALIIGFLVMSLLTVVVYKFVPPPLTPIMVLRVIEGVFDGQMVGITKTWKSYEEISPNIYRALVSGEDARFMSHNGIDWKAVENAKRYNAAHEGVRKHGASTITMQTAKNAFLWHGRNYVRKGLEAYFTYLIEAIWGKKRILEIYVNIIEWGPGIYGVEAASQEYFKKSSTNLTKNEAALLAAIVPNPRRWSAAKPTDYIIKRQNFIMGRMGGVPIPKKK